MRNALLLSFVVAFTPALSSTAAPRPVEAGIAVRDITPSEPIFLAGYASRRKPSESIDTRLKVQALALRSGGGPFVFVALDNCEVSHAFMEPVLQKLAAEHALPRGSVMVVSSHTHSAPVLADTLEVMAIMPPSDREIVQRYSARLRDELVQVVAEAVDRLQPAQLAHGVGNARFAMNRRVYRPGGVQFGENPVGPVDHEVPVMRLTDEGGELVAILFGYACHGTSIQGNGFFAVSGDYMAYAREHLEALYPRAVAMYVTGMGADSNPSPRGDILDARRHGLELAGAVIEVLNRPMRRVVGPLRHAYTEVTLDLEPAPDRPSLEADAASENIHVQRRARKFLEWLDQGDHLPQSIQLPVSVVRLGNDLTFVNVAGEVVVDYSIRLKNLHAHEPLWTIGYAYEVPCYIPSIRILKEGGYEAESSLIYYGLYGPFTPAVEPNLLDAISGLLHESR